MKPRAKKLLVRLGLAAGALFAALVGAELLLRAFPDLLSEQARLKLHWAGLAATESTTVPHPTIGYVARPGLEETLERTDLSFTYRIDERGFRNPRPWPDEADVVVTGDSLAFGYGVDDGEGWTDLLQEELPGLRLVNLGIVGGAPQMGAAAYEAYGVALRPKVLLIGLFLGNDVYDARMYATWRERTGGEGNFAVWRAFGGREPDVTGELFGLLKRSYLFALWQDLRTKKRFEGRTLELEGGGRVQLAPDILASAVVRDTSSPDFTRVVAAVEREAERARAEGTHPVVLFFPTKEEVYLPLVVERSPDAIGPFARAFAERGLETLDPTPALREGARAGQMLYFEIDGHPNAAGYAVIADVVAEHLRENAERYGLELR